MTIKTPLIVESATTPSLCPYNIIPDNDAPLPTVVRGIYVGSGGDVTLRGVEGTGDVVYRNLPDASYIAVYTSHVRASGTTASDLVGEI